jgi:glucose-6-phosphate-specific signal transduction histidine kinase
MAATGDLPSLPAAVEVAAYRIALEALYNVLRHAAASSCTIRLAFHDQALCLEVTTTAAASPSHPDGGRGPGLHARTRRRARRHLHHHRPAPGGTRVSAHLPCQDQPANKESPAWRSPSAS